ncbi:uncharacterized protein [Watersipora subatra]|uniref:uncharacterized protein n=1 Tax=Watersipora subatra TaxID=2589382 RepID=UPI00355AF5F5
MFVCVGSDDGQTINLVDEQQRFPTNGEVVTVALNCCLVLIAVLSATFCVADGLPKSRVVKNKVACRDQSNQMRDVKLWSLNLTFEAEYKVCACVPSTGLSPITNWTAKKEPLLFHCDDL